MKSIRATNRVMLIGLITDRSSHAAWREDVRGDCPCVGYVIVTVRIDCCAAVHILADAEVFVIVGMGWWRLFQYLFDIEGISPGQEVMRSRKLEFVHLLQKIPNDG